MENGISGTINGQNILMFKKEVILKRQSLTILAKATWDNRERDTRFAEGMDYDEVKQHIKKNFLTLVDKDKVYQVNVLTAGGWKGGKTFRRNYITENDFFNPLSEYDDGVPIEEIYGIQIIYF